MTPSEMVQAGKQALFAAQEGSEEGKAELEKLRGPFTVLAEEGDADAQSLLDGVARRPGSRAQIILLESLLAGADPDGKAATSEYDLIAWSV